MKLNMGMGCKGCRGLQEREECSCISVRERQIEELDKEILQLKSLRSKVAMLENIISVLEEMTNTDISIEITELN